MKIFTIKALTILFFSFLCAKTLYAQNYKNQFTLTPENDMYVNPNHDRYYSDATIFTFTHALTPAKKDSNLVKKILELQFGQQIYNAYTSDAKRANRIDRPFTGYLYAGATLNWLYADESALKFTVQLGTIGPNALGENIQTNFHKIFKLHPVEGWQYQLKNELGLNLDLDYKKLLYRNPAKWFDLTFDPEVRLGNTFTNANVGMQLRFGQLGKLYQSAGTNSRVSISNETQKHEFYFFAEPQFSYVAYNATIQGGLFRDDKGPITFGIYHIVYIQQLGLQFASARWSANYIVYIRTREVKSTALGDQYGSVSIAYRFGKI